MLTVSQSFPRLIEHLTSLGKKLIWATDKYLGNYVIDKTGADILIGTGSVFSNNPTTGNTTIKCKK